MKIGKERASVWSLFFSGGVGFFIRALSRGSMGAGLRRFAPTILYPVRFLKPQTSSIQRTKSSVRCTFHSPQSPLARWVRLGLLSELWKRGLTRRYSPMDGQYFPCNHVSRDSIRGSDVLLTGSHSTVQRTN